MNERIISLRHASTSATPRISAERAVLLTRFMQSQGAREEHTPIRRALAFKYILQHKEIFIQPGELIVGERGPSPQETPTYPEICLHSLQDLEILNSREKIPFAVDDGTRHIYEEEIIPYWRGGTIRERIFTELPQAWITAYEAGIFTEFLEQRAPGHTVLDDKIYRKGMIDFIRDIDLVRDNLDHKGDQGAPERCVELQAMRYAAEAIIMFAHRHASLLDEVASHESDPLRKAELVDMAEICRHVPAHAPLTFHEALQYYWFVHLGVITELNPWDSFNPGRLDQHLLPFYTRDLAQGRIDKERARELLQAFWIKFSNHPAPPKVGVTAKESNTYTDFALINLGGVRPDGSDAVNELTYLILDVIGEMRLLQPSSMIQVSKKNPDRFILGALKIIRTGFGQPSVFNTDTLIQQMLRQGKDIVDARSGGASGCVETGAFGKEAYILTGYFNLPKVLEITLNNGTDPRTGKATGIETGDPASFTSFDDLMKAYEKQLRYFADIKIAGNHIIEKIWAQHMPVPFLSLLTDDCINNGRDYNNGGARYNTRYIQGVGLGSITDSLTALKHHVFERKTGHMKDFLEVMRKDFDGHDEFRKMLTDETPKYGNDDDRADDVLREVFEIWFRAVDGRPTASGGVHRINLLPTTCHVYFGSVTGALPDGRRAWTPLSEGISPVQGADRKGPTAVLKSAAKIDHIRTGGTLLNMKFTPSFLRNDEGLLKLMQLIRSYFRMDGHHVQFNVVTAATLKKAKKNPGQYRDLIVRVAGYSDYFVDLTDELQDEIIRRTEHGEIDVSS
ncbi:MAG: glycyl radical protein [Bacteroidales bacterium]|nr:glycyl radical protein [Bacteroidales bacterium]